MLLVALAIAAPASLGAQRPSGAPRKPMPISAMGWLVGGTWIAEIPNGGPEAQRIETRYRWSDNDAYIRFTTHFVSAKGTLNNYDGSFFWDSDQATLAMWYMDAANAITQGPVKIAGDTMSMSFRSGDHEGKPAEYRVTVSRRNNDDYAWLLEQRANSAWKFVLALEYRRRAE